VSPDKYIVSDVIAIVSVLAAFTNVRAVPTGYGTEALAGIVNVLALLSDEG
jgi:hypothetical protein